MEVGAYQIGILSLFEELPAGHGVTVDDEHNFSSPDGRSVRENHPDVRVHATNMRSRSQW